MMYASEQLIIVLGNNDIDVDGWQAITEALTNSPRLAQLNLSKRLSSLSYR